MLVKNVWIVRIKSGKLATIVKSLPVDVLNCLPILPMFYMAQIMYIPPATVTALDIFDVHDADQVCIRYSLPYIRAPL